MVAVIIVEAIILGSRKANYFQKPRPYGTEMDEEVYTASSKIRNSAAFGEIIIPYRLLALCFAGAGR